MSAQKKWIVSKNLLRPAANQTLGAACVCNQCAGHNTGLQLWKEIDNHTHRSRQDDEVSFADRCGHIHSDFVYSPRGMGAAQNLRPVESHTDTPTVMLAERQSPGPAH